jgi:hypothetical protein
MGKLNALLTNWTSARASKLDNIGATGDTGGSTSAGTIMGKLNAIISKLSSGITASNWYAAYGTGTTIASASNVVKTSSAVNTAIS